MDINERNQLEKQSWLTYEEAMAYAGYSNRGSFANFLSSRSVKRNPAGSGTVETASLMKALGRK